jgi:hypothetical protein
VGLLAVGLVPVLSPGLMAQVVHIGDTDRATAQASYGQLPLSFEPNVGQADSQVSFVSHSAGQSLFLTADKAVLALGHPASGSSTPPPDVLRLEVLGADPAAPVRGLERLPGTANYFIGDDPSQWRTGIPTYSRVSYEGVLPGVDVVWYGNGGKLEFDFVLAPGVDPATVRLAYGGAQGLSLNSSGELLVQLPGGTLTQHAPRLYQESGGVRRAVAGHYLLLGGDQVGFAVGAFDTALPLVIDPTLAYSSYLGGSGDDAGNGIAVDGVGRAYVVGQTTSTDFPATLGAFQTTSGGGSDVFVAKLNPTGTALIYTTYLGGSSADVGRAIAVDRTGRAYVTGQTNSSNFPTVGGGIAGACEGLCGTGMGTPIIIGTSVGDVFVTKLSPDGSALDYSTYLGGSGFEEGRGIAVDGTGAAYVTGSTRSTDFPTTPGAFQTVLGGSAVLEPIQNTPAGGSHNGFVTKINPAGDALVYSTYLGGIVHDEIFAIAIDGAGNAYLTGYTLSFDYPRVGQIPGACNGLCGTVISSATIFTLSNRDAFVTKLNPAGSALVYSSLLGGSGSDEGRGIALDGTGSAHVTGRTSPTPQLPSTLPAPLPPLALPSVSVPFPVTDFPTTPGAFQTTPGSSTFDAFVTKVNPAGSALAYSTLLGGSGVDEGNGIAIGRGGRPSVTGFTTSANFPRVDQIPGACAGTCGTGANSDAFVTRLNLAGSGLVYSTLLGGSSADEGRGIAVRRGAHITGVTTSANFPRVGQIPGACAGTCGTGVNSDAFVSRLVRS